jgi:KDO2-lipid IV(A) lauroyltransferase
MHVHSIVPKPIRPSVAGLLAGRDRRAARQYWLIDPYRGFVGAFLQALMRILPIDVASELGAMFGVSLGRITRSFVAPGAETRAAWRILRPDPDCVEFDVAMKQARRQIGRVMSEYAVLDRLWKAKRIAVSGAEHIESAQQERRPIIIAGLHLSNWEVIGPALAGLGYKVNAIYEPPPNRFDHAVVVAARRRWGANLLLPDRAGTMQAYRSLVRRDGVLLMYIDELLDDQPNAPAFGRARAANGNIGHVVRLAAMTGAVILPTYVERTAGARFRMAILPAANAGATRDDKADLPASVARLDAVIEPVVRSHLASWYFLPKFKTAF